MGVELWSKSACVKNSRWQLCEHVFVKEKDVFIGKSMHRDLGKKRWRLWEPNVAPEWFEKVRFFEKNLNGKFVPFGLK